MASAVDFADAESQRQTLHSPVGTPSGVRLGSLPEDSEQDLRFVQDRLAMLAKITFFISTMFLVAASIAELAGEAQRVPLASRLSHGIGTSIALLAWLGFRVQHTFSPRTLSTLDIAATLGICVSFMSMGHHARQPFGFYTGMLAVTHVSISRAMIVPSLPWRTFWLAAASFAGFVISRATLPLHPEIAEMGSRARGVVEALLWSTSGTAVATVASKVIYGLHAKAREARQLGQYALEGKIGSGGMGEIYRARHAMLRRPTAIKLLSGDGSETQLRRFEREVQQTARLTHPNTISIYDYGRTPEGIFYYAMELLDGLTLEELVERHGPQPAGRVIHILRQVCGALSEAHHIGLIHRDIKPANIYLCERGGIADFVKVLDFGLVREIRGDESLTRSNINVVVGTPLYLSPDAILTPDDLDARADIYGLGCVAYYLLTGTPPFSGNSIFEVCSHHLQTPPEPLSRHQPVPADLERVILSCLAKNRTDRPASAHELGQELERCRDARSWTAVAANGWWSSVGKAHTETLGEPFTAPPDGPQPTSALSRKVCCVDLERRLAQPS